MMQTSKENVKHSSEEELDLKEGTKDTNVSDNVV